MRLTRRDAIVALAATGATIGVGSMVRSSNEPRSNIQAPIDAHGLTTLIAAAAVLYPSEIGGIDQFVEQYIRGRIESRPEHASEIADAVGYLDEYATAWHDTRFASLDSTDREQLLRAMGADTAVPDSEGSNVERVRYYVVNELLFALYSTPTGGKLVGIENPRGYSGGMRSYQRGPRA